MTLVPRTTAVLIAAAPFIVAAAVGLTGCSQQHHPAASPSAETSPAPSVGLPAPPRTAPGGPPLPPATALVDVLNRLADPAVPGDQKAVLIEGGSPTEAPALDRFGIALRDNGSLPLAIQVRDLAWSTSNPGNVVATVVIKTATPQGEFSYPMEFAPGPQGSWQLTRTTADLVLELDDDQPAAPPPPVPTPTR